MDIASILQACEREIAISAGLGPDGFEAFVRAAQSGEPCCSAVWKKGSWAFRCKTCGLSGSSAICRECFDPEVHRNHEYVMYQSESGGCCDCGDPRSWRTEGNCARHRPRPAGDQAFRPATLAALEAAFGLALAELIRAALVWGAAAEAEALRAGVGRSPEVAAVEACLPAPPGGLAGPPTLQAAAQAALAELQPVFTWLDRLLSISCLRGPACRAGLWALAPASGSLSAPGAPDPTPRLPPAAADFLAMRRIMSRQLFSALRGAVAARWAAAAFGEVPGSRACAPLDAVLSGRGTGVGQYATLVDCLTAALVYTGPTQWGEGPGESLTTVLLLLSYESDTKVTVTRALLDLGAYEILAGLTPRAPAGPSGPPAISRALDRLTVHLWLSREAVMSTSSTGETLLAHLCASLRRFLETFRRSGDPVAAAALPDPALAAAAALPWRPLDPSLFDRRSHAFHRALGDIRLVLSHEDIVRQLVEAEVSDSDAGGVGGASPLQYSWSAEAEALLSLAQGCFVLQRMIGQHVEYESSTWLTAVILEQSLVTAAVRSPLLSQDTEGPGQAHEESSQSLLPAAGLAALSKKLANAAAQKSLAVIHSITAPGDAAAGQDIYETLDTVRAPTTTHLPLHRAATAYLWAALTSDLQRRTVRMRSGQGAGDVGQEGPWGFLPGGGEEPPAWVAEVWPVVARDSLTVLAQCAQIRSRLWILNGQEVAQMEHLMRSSYAQEDTLQLDCLAVQIWLAAARDAGAAMLDFLAAFGAAPLLTWPRVEEGEEGAAPPASLDDKRLACVADGLGVLVSLLRDAKRPGEAPAQLVRRHLVQLLAASAPTDGLTHSQIAERMPRCVGEVALIPLLDTQLDEVATRSEARFSQQARYTLKPEALAEFDPFWRLTHPSQQGAALDRAMESAGGAASGTGPQGSRGPSYDPCGLPRGWSAARALPEVLQPAARVLLARPLIQALEASLRLAAAMGTSSPVGLERAALHLLAMSLGHLKWDGARLPEGAAAREQLSDMASGLRTLLAGIQRQGQGPGGPHRDLPLLASLCSVRLDEALGGGPATGGVGDAEGGQAVQGQAGGGREAAQRRMAAMMQQMQRQQQQAAAGFLGELSDSESDEEVEEEQGEEGGRAVHMGEDETPNETPAPPVLPDRSRAFLGGPHATHDPSTSPEVCVICLQGASAAAGPLGVIALVQRNNLPEAATPESVSSAAARRPPWVPQSGSHPSNPPPEASSYPRAPSLDRLLGLSVHSCGHACHTDCLERHRTALAQAAGSAAYRLMTDTAHVDTRGERAFLCPLCKRLGNCTLEAAPGGAGEGPAPREAEAEADRYVFAAARGAAVAAAPGGDNEEAGPSEAALPRVSGGIPRQAAESGPLSLGLALPLLSSLLSAADAQVRVQHGPAPTSVDLSLLARCAREFEKNTGTRSNILHAPFWTSGLQLRPGLTSGGAEDAATAAPGALHAHPVDAWDSDGEGGAGHGGHAQGGARQSPGPHGMDLMDLGSDAEDEDGGSGSGSESGSDVSGSSDGDGDVEAVGGPGGDDGDDDFEDDEDDGAWEIEGADDDEMGEGEGEAAPDPPGRPPREGLLSATLRLLRSAAAAIGRAASLRVNHGAQAEEAARAHPGMGARGALDARPLGLGPGAFHGLLYDRYNGSEDEALSSLAFQLLWPAALHLAAQCEVAGRAPLLPGGDGGAAGASAASSSSQAAGAVQVFAAETWPPEPSRMRGLRALLFAAWNAQPPRPAADGPGGSVAHPRSSHLTPQALRSWIETATLTEGDGGRLLSDPYSLLLQLWSCAAQAGKAAHRSHPSISASLATPVLTLRAAASVAVHAGLAAASAEALGLDPTGASLDGPSTSRAVLTALSDTAGCGQARAFLEDVSRRIHPVLARAQLMQWALLGCTSLRPGSTWAGALAAGKEAAAGPFHASADQLAASLGLPPIADMVRDGVQRFLLGRTAEGRTEAAAVGHASASSRLPCNPPPPPALFMPLPDSYDSLFLTLGPTATCDACGVSLSERALCLKCGECLCVSDGCRYRHPPHGQHAGGEGHNAGLGLPPPPAPPSRPSIIEHAEQCGSGLAAMLLVKLTRTMIIRENRIAIGPSLYLDRHGEEDMELARGKPLRLSDQRLRTLVVLARGDAMDQDATLSRQFRAISRGRLPFQLQQADQ